MSAPETGAPLSSVTVPASLNADAVENAVISAIGNTKKKAFFMIKLLSRNPNGFRFLECQYRQYNF